MHSYGFDGVVHVVCALIALTRYQTYSFVHISIYSCSFNIEWAPLQLGFIELSAPVCNRGSHTFVLEGKVYGHIDL